MPWIIAGGALLGGMISSQGSQSAANTQANATNQANANQMGMFNQTQQNLAPYMAAGSSGLNQLNSFLQGPGSQYYPGFSYNPASDPLYNWELNQGLGAITNQASALGGVNSGNTLKALSNYGENQALNSYQQEFQNYNNNLNNWQAQTGNIYNRLSNVVGLGENAAAGVGNAGLQTANIMGANTTGLGNTQAANDIAQGNIWGGTLQQAFGALGSNPTNPYATPSYYGNNALGAMGVTSGYDVNNPSAYVGGGY